MRATLLRPVPFLSALAVTGLLLASMLAAAEPDGKAVFVDGKCNMCHSVESQGIEKKLKSGKGKDLSNVGTERDPAWLTKWLRKEVELDGKPHEKAFKGSDAELAALVKWLGTLKKK
jgi:mono/diheme cytochrome c family protein